MKRWILLFVVLILNSGPRISGAQSNYEVVVAQLPGACLKWLNLAEPEFRKKNIDLSNYNITVVEHQVTVDVGIISVDAPEGSKGSGGSRPGYDVEISKRDRRVIRIYGVR